MSVVRRNGAPPRPPQRERSEGWSQYLDRGEKLLWEGAPSGGVKFRASDLVQSLFGLLFLGFAIFWIFGAATLGGGAPGLMGIFFPLFGLPFVAVGSYIAFGRFFWKAHVRSRTRYALTDKRAIVATDGWRRALQFYPISADTTLEYEPGHEATIWFAKEERRGQKGRRYTVNKGFEYIDDGDEVYRLIRRIQQGDPV